MRTLLSTRLSLVSLRCSRLDTGETRIHIKGFLRAHLRRCNLLDAGGNLISNNDESRSYLRGEELRELRREFLAALLSLYLLGKESSSNSGILKLNSEFSSGLGLRNVLPASEDDVMQMLRRVSSATSTILDELRRGSLRLRCGQFVVDLSLHIQQACRRRLLELEFIRAAGLQIANTPRAPWSLLSTSTSICHHPMVLPDLGVDSVESDTQGMYSLRGVPGVYELPKRLNDQNGWKRLHDALAAENAGLSPAERQRRYHRVAALGNSSPTTQTQAHLQAQLVASPEAGVDDDLHEEDPRIVEAHSRIDDLTDYLWSIPGFEGYCTTLADAAQEDADSYEREGDADSDVDVASVEAIHDDLIEAWLDDQVEDWLDVYTGFQAACCQDAFDDGCSGIGCSGDDDYGCSGDGSQEQADGYSDDGNEEDALHYGYEEDALHHGYEEDAHY